MFEAPSLVVEPASPEVSEEHVLATEDETAAVQISIRPPTSQLPRIEEEEELETSAT